MKKKEKTHFILEQMRLCLLRKDYVRTQIMSRKINAKVFEDNDFQELKINYYKLMIEFYSHENQYLDIFRCYQFIFNTPNILSDPQASKLYLSLSVVYIILAPYNNEQNDLLNKLFVHKSMQNLSLFKNILHKFLKLELIDWNALIKLVKSDFDLLPCFSTISDYSSVENLWNDLHDRTIEHNIRVISQYYSKITLDRFSNLLGVDQTLAEKHLCNLVINESIFARIDRIEQTINFVKKQEAFDTLEDWSSDISSLLHLVDNTCHLIQRENMIHENQKTLTNVINQ